MFKMKDAGVRDHDSKDNRVLLAVRAALFPDASSNRRGHRSGDVTTLSSPSFETPIATAFSGGLDSMVLLDAVCAVVGASNCIALHIHHGLSPHADAWLDHTRRIAESMGARFASRRVDLSDCAGQGVEAAARTARYAALFELCDASGATALTLGHHADDQAETFLLQAMRGAGVRGLSAMPALARDRHHGLPVLRPLLSLPRTALLAYAKQRELEWIDDESNADPRFARNALRHQVLNALETHFPAYRAGLARSARHAAEAQELLDELAFLDLQAVVCDESTANDALSLSALRTLDARNPRRVVNLLRFWIRDRGLHALSSARLDDLLIKLRLASHERPLHFEHDGHVLRRHRDIVRWESAIVAHVSLPEYEAAPGEHDPVVLASLGLLDDGDGRAQVSASLQWSGETVWTLPAWHGSLIFAPTGVEDPLRVPADLLRKTLLVARARQGGERLRLVTGGPSRSLKNLFQQASVPSWRRDVPLIFSGERLIFVPGVGVDCAVLEALTTTPSSSVSNDVRHASQDAAAGMLDEGSFASPHQWRRLEWHPDSTLAAPAPRD
jgi:tRNA(Ile)-lysidine synthase